MFLIKNIGLTTGVSIREQKFMKGGWEWHTGTMLPVMEMHG
jgi:hypothetical protein